MFFSDLEINSTESTLSTPPPSQQHADNHHNHNQSTSERADAAAAKDAEASMDVDQLVKPSKIHVQPLHPVDLLYESTKYDPSAGEYCKKYNRNMIYSRLLFIKSQIKTVCSLLWALLGQALDRFQIVDLFSLQN